ncbi:MAG: class I mannose-6-phosphate isomerase, partial [Chitinispirillaceae bacterium]|nr:class I mannose-6-phosphate isomerase [Chitinispirillaceae bacterium]
MRLPVEPILLEPHFEEKVWGGNKLKTLLNKKIPEDVIIGESWEVSAIEKKESYVVEGQLSGENLRSLYKKFPEEILGKNHKKYPKFPLLIKFIDAKEKLSIQVHPKSSSSEKNECWFIVSPGEKGAISTGFNKKVDKKEVLSALSFKKIEELLNVVRVKEEEVYFIPAGTIHAILEDVLIYEIQQSSNITFRLYDWDRNSTISKQRALHIKEALEEIEFSDKKDFL